MKKQIKVVIQMAIFIFALLMGFMFTYTLIWMQFDLPLTWWAGLILSVNAGLSVIGLTRWIANG